MTKGNKLALIISYYLSKFNREGLVNLGYKTFNKAYSDIGTRLSVKPKTVKNMRDEFDPVNDNPRVGWYQREMSISRKKVVELFQDLSEEDYRHIIIDILTGSDLYKKSGVEEVLDVVKDKSKRSIFIVRGPTGKKAEEFFINYQKVTGLPFDGVLIDKRESGCGYDFEIEKNNKRYFIEVKGVSEIEGGILFTNKEWQTAKEKGNLYYLALVSNIGVKPTIKFINNPAANLKPRKNISTIVQVSWAIGNKELRNIIV